MRIRLLRMTVSTCTQPEFVRSNEKKPSITLLPRPITVRSRAIKSIVKGFHEVEYIDCALEEVGIEIRQILTP